MHVKGMTALHDRVPEELRGTYAGLATPAVIDYLADLGVTAVELLPVHQFTSEPALVERGLENYWGYNSLGLLRPAQRLQRLRRPRRAGHRVQADGEGVPRGRDGGHPRRRLQPHRRGRSARADAVLPRLRRPHLPPAAGAAAGGARPGHLRPHPRAAGHLLGRHRLRQHRRHRPADGAADDPRLAALLGDRDARGRLPLRPHVGADPHRLRGRHALPPADHHRPGPDPAAREADRRAVGRLERGLPGRRVPAGVGGVERPVPRHHARLLAGLTAPSAPSPPGSPAPPTCTPTTGGRRTPRSTS